MVGLATADAGPDVTICIGDTTQLNASGGSSYLWSPNIDISNIVVPDPFVYPTVTMDYSVLVVDTNGCQANDTVNVFVSPLPIADAGPGAVICVNDSAQLNASGGVSYQWSPAASLSDTGIADPLAFPIVTTQYTVLVTDAIGCENVDSTIVTVNPLPTPDAGPDTAICIFDSTQLGATGGVGYQWSPVTGLSNPNIANPWASPTVTTEYIVTVTDGNGCENSDTVLVTVNPLPIADAGPDVTICQGDLEQLNASGGVTYQWSPTGGLSDPNIADPQTSPPSTTTYTVLVTDANGCQASDDVLVVVNLAPIIDAGPDITLCIGDTGQFNASGGVTYSWTPTAGLGNVNSPNPLVFTTVTTTYTVVGIDANGCDNSDSVTVFINPLPIIDAGADATICINDSTQLNASGGVSYSWLSLIHI